VLNSSNAAHVQLTVYMTNVMNLLACPAVDELMKLCELLKCLLSVISTGNERKGDVIYFKTIIELLKLFP
jgi:hypothetical protein